MHSRAPISTFARMGLSTERKVFIGILALAGVSLVIDQGFLRGPSSAGAGVLDLSQVVDEPIAAAKSDIASSIKETISTALSDRINDALASTDRSRDPSTLFFDPPPIPETLPDDAPAIKPAAITAAPAPTLSDLPTLTSCMPSRTGQSGAILDGKLYLVGQTTPQGYTLTQVIERQAIVTRNDREYTLSVPSKQ